MVNCLVPYSLILLIANECLIKDHYYQVLPDGLMLGYFSYALKLLHKFSHRLVDSVLHQCLLWYWSGLNRQTKIRPCTSSRYQHKTLSQCTTQVFWKSINHCWTFCTVWRTIKWIKIFHFFIHFNRIISIESGFLFCWNCYILSIFLHFQKIDIPILYLGFRLNSF